MLPALLTLPLWPAATVLLSLLLLGFLVADDCCLIERKDTLYTQYSSRASQRLQLGRVCEHLTFAMLHVSQEFLS